MSDLMARLLRILAQWAGIEIRPLPAPPPPLPEPPAPPQPTPPPPPPPTEDSTGLIAAINRARSSAGLLALVEDATLDRSAAAWAGVMATGRGLTHGDFAARITAVSPGTSAGEDIAEGQPTAAAVVAAWMDSPPHRANILGDYARIGAGSGRDDNGAIFWCADFVGKD